MRHACLGLTIVAAAVLAAGCGSEPAAAKGAGKGSAAAAKRDPSAPEEIKQVIADLEKSERWFGVSCRWLESGAHVLAWPQETAVLQAAASLGFIELTQVGTGNRIGKMEPAWSIVLTDNGKAEAKTCPPSSKSTTFGMPVTRSRIISAKYLSTDRYDRATYEVDYVWEPTDLGQRVKYELTGNMAVDEGLFRTKAIMDKRSGGGYYPSAVGRGERVQ